MNKALKELTDGTKERNETYALVTVDKDEAVFAWHGDLNLLDELVTKLGEKIKEKLLN